jgi:hypothetical protein
VRLHRLWALIISPHHNVHSLASVCPHMLTFGKMCINFYLFVVYLKMFFFSNYDYTPPNDRVISEWWIGKDLEGSGHDLILRYYPGICLEGLRKTMKTLRQDSQSLSQDLNLGFPDHKAGVVTTWPRCLVMKCVMSTTQNKKRFRNIRNLKPTYKAEVTMYTICWNIHNLACHKVSLRVTYNYRNKPFPAYHYL